MYTVAASIGSEAGSQGLIDKDIAFSSEMSHEYWTDEDLGGAVYILTS
jgi:hypothetical protein